MSLMLFQQFSGINAIIFYSASIFQEAGSSVDRFVSSITIGLVQLVLTMTSALLVSTYFQDTIELKPMFCISWIMHCVLGGSIWASRSAFSFWNFHGSLPS